MLSAELAARLSKQIARDLVQGIECAGLKVWSPSSIGPEMYNGVQPLVDAALLRAGLRPDVYAADVLGHSLRVIGNYGGVSSHCEDAIANALRAHWGRTNILYDKLVDRVYDSLEEIDHIDDSVAWQAQAQGRVSVCLRDHGVAEPPRGECAGAVASLLNRGNTLDWPHVEKALRKALTDEAIAVPPDPKQLALDPVPAEPESGEPAQPSMKERLFKRCEELGLFLGDKNDAYGNSAADRL